MPTMHEHTKLNTSVHANTDGVDRHIMPFMSRGFTFTNLPYHSASNVKQKSRVANQSKRATFNFRPLKRGEKTVLPFRSPDATLPSLSFISPWLSASAENLRDRGSPCSDGGRGYTAGEKYPPGMLHRSQTVLLPVRARMVDLSSAYKPELSFAAKSNSLAGNVHSPSHAAREITSVTSTPDLNAATKGTAINIIAPVAPTGSVGDGKFSPYNEGQQMTSDGRPGSRELALRGTNSCNSTPDVPPQTVNRLNLDDSRAEDETDDDHDLLYPITNKYGQFYKPLLGDRSLFMKESYPTSPKVYHSDIDQVRSEGHAKLHIHNGQWSAHFSILNKGGWKHRPLRKALTLNEARREQHRQSVAAHNPRRRYRARMLARGENLG